VLKTTRGPPPSSLITAKIHFGILRKLILKLFIIKVIIFLFSALKTNKKVRNDIYRVSLNVRTTAHRKVDGIGRNIKVPYRFAIFVMITKMSIFIIELIRARREKALAARHLVPAHSLLNIGCRRHVGEARGEVIANV